VWIGTGILFGIILCCIISNWDTESGTFKYYDIISKITLLIGIIGYALMGLFFSIGFSSFEVYILLMVLIGIGSIGYYGFVFLSIV